MQSSIDFQKDPQYLPSSPKRCKLSVNWFRVLGRVKIQRHPKVCCLHPCQVLVKNSTFMTQNYIHKLIQSLQKLRAGTQFTKVSLTCLLRMSIDEPTRGYMKTFIDRNEVLNFKALYGLLKCFHRTTRSCIYFRHTLYWVSILLSNL